MPRIARGLADGYIYHILNRGNGKQLVFHNHSDYRNFAELIKEAKKRYSIKIYAYCLMPNHFHIVLMPHQAEDLSKYMQWLMTSHVRRYHKKYNSSGHVWQGRFKSFIVQDDSYLLTVLRYVEGNPVRAGLVKTCKDWLWSSHRDVIEGYRKNFIDKAPIGIPKDWTKYVDETLTETEKNALLISINRQRPFGSADWQGEICKKFNLESTLRKRGRPTKQDSKK